MIYSRCYEFVTSSKFAKALTKYWKKIQLTRYTNTNEKNNQCKITCFAGKCFHWVKFATQEEWVMQVIYVTQMKY